MVREFLLAAIAAPLIFAGQARAQSVAINPVLRGKNVIDNQIVNDMAQRRHAYLTILKNAPHPNAAILFTLYMVSHHEQEKVMWDYFGQDVDTLPDSHMHQAVQKLHDESIKTIEVTMDWWRGHQGIDKQNEELAKLVTRC